MEIIHLKSSSSTNSALLEMSKKSAKSWTVIWTSNQTQGRGYAGNVWKTELDQNLAVSVLINSDLKYSELFFLNNWVANVLVAFLSAYSDEVYVKWPNDIIMKNKKICGVLIETHKSVNQLSIVIGIGLNVNQKDFSNLPSAGSLFTQTDKIYNLEEILSGILTKMENHYYKIKERQFEIIVNSYNSKLFRKDLSSIFVLNGKEIEGVIKYVNTLGQLVVELNNGTLETFNHKEIQLLY